MRYLGSYLSIRLPVVTNRDFSNGNVIQAILAFLLKLKSIFYLPLKHISLPSYATQKKKCQCRKTELVIHVKDLEFMFKHLEFGSSFELRLRFLWLGAEVWVKENYFALVGSDCWLASNGILGFLLKIIRPYTTGSWNRYYG